MLDENTKNVIKEKFKEIESPVKLTLIKSGENCVYCSQIEELLNELNELSEKLSVEIKEEQVENSPVILIQGKENRNVKYHGIPAGHEFTPFLQTIVESSTKPSIPVELKEKINAIDFPVQINVFVSPTCPHCPGAMKAAFDFALINPNIKADVFEVTEFKELASKYNVMGVPKTVINEKLDLVGAYPPDIIVKKILELKE